MTRKWWFTVAAALVTAMLYRNRLRANLKQASANVRAFDLPSAGAYDTRWSPRSWKASTPASPARWPLLTHTRSYWRSGVARAGSPCGWRERLPA